MDKKTHGDTTQGKTNIFSQTDIAALRHDMLRFAILQLRDTSSAEDAVQEALSAACATRDRFAGRSQINTWVFSILRNKIIDILRERARHPTRSLTLEDGSDDELNELFDEQGRWRKEACPTDWGQPEALFINGQFWRMFEACLGHLPENTSRVFMMRELLGLDTKEICTELDITEGNCWVTLHRARGRLRLCLEKNWIKGEGILC